MSLFCTVLFHFLFTDSRTLIRYSPQEHERKIIAENRQTDNIDIQTTQTTQTTEKHFQLTEKYKP